MSTAFKFEALRNPVQWTGRYNRIPGKEPVLRTTVRRSAHAYWKPWNSGEILTSPFVDGPEVQKLITAVNNAKELHVGRPGGAFQIDEFGQVLCPIIGSSARYWVGNVSGVPTFEGPRREGAAFELRLPTSTEPGAPWERPYIGMKFNLDANNSIYFQEDDGDTRHRTRLTNSNPDLVDRLRTVRGRGSTIRFVVNLHGVVLTKQEPGWQPVFVGFIDLARWFPKQP